MSLAFRVTYAAYCSGSHHKLAMDALCHLQNEYRERWKNIFLKYAPKFIEGAKAPDKVFKDFANHVLHVEENYWGGAPQKAEEWYHKLVQALKDKNWPEAAYNAGVLSHYYTDPIQPLHTAQSENENNIHRAFEWSISKSYNDLKKIGEREFANTKVSVPLDANWLEQLVKKGAKKARPHYEQLVEQYDFKKGVKVPQEGLNQESSKILAELIIYAAIGFSKILDKAFEEANVIPPHVDLNISVILAGLNIPVRWVTSKMEDKKERKLVEKMYEELQNTGKVEDNLPEDDKCVRDLYVEEILSSNKPGSLAEALSKLKHVARQMREVEQKDNQKWQSSQQNNRASRHYLEPSDDIEKAPSIGKKTAARLLKVDINTVSDLLGADAVKTANYVNVKYITPDLIKDWQDQSNLMCKIKGLRGYHAQLLVALNYRIPKEIGSLKPEKLLDELLAFIKTNEGKRIIRSGKKPQINEVGNWVEDAKSSATKKAA